MCQKCIQGGSWHLWHPSVSAFGETYALLWVRRDKCPEAALVRACHDKVGVECGAEQAVEAKAWLEKAMINGVEEVLNGTGKARMPVEVEARIVRSWGEGG